nr:hypothetical protein CFP56_73096 [Quercus suber]
MPPITNPARLASRTSTRTMVAAPAPGWDAPTFVRSAGVIDVVELSLGSVEAAAAVADVLNVSLLLLLLLLLSVIGELVLVGEPEIRKTLSVLSERGRVVTSAGNSTDSGSEDVVAVCAKAEAAASRRRRAGSIVVARRIIVCCGCVNSGSLEELLGRLYGIYYSPCHRIDQTIPAI